MFRFTKPTILQCPNGRYTFVGGVPQCLCEQREASPSDVMAGRARKAPDGSMIVYKPRSFDTRQQALDFAQSQGVTPFLPSTP